LYGGTNSNYQIVNVGGSDNELQITGGNSSSTSTRYAYQNIDWASRISGNEVIYSEFKIATGAAVITSTNSFNVLIYDATLN
jgi:hypothetical protein